MWVRRGPAQYSPSLRCLALPEPLRRVHGVRRRRGSGSRAGRQSIGTGTGTGTDRSRQEQEYERLCVYATGSRRLTDRPITANHSIQTLRIGGTCFGRDFQGKEKKVPRLGIPRNSGPRTSLPRCWRTWIGAADLCSAGNVSAAFYQT